MSGGSPRGRYLRFLAFAVVVAAGLVALGFLPTRRFAGDAGLPAMVVGCVISLTAAAVAGWLLVTVEAKTPTGRMRTAFLAMVVRLTVVAGLGLVAVLSGELARMPLLFWVAVSYLALLPLEVKLAIE